MKHSLITLLGILLFILLSPLSGQPIEPEEPVAETDILEGDVAEKDVADSLSKKVLSPGTAANNDTLEAAIKPDTAKIEDTLETAETPGEPDSTAKAPPSPALDLDKKTLAVLHFTNLSGSEEYAPLEKAMADMVITDLSQVGTLTLVEREKINALANEMSFTTSDSHRKPNQVKMATRVKSGSVITGKISVDQDKEMKIEAILLNPMDNSEKPVGEASGTVEEFFKLEKILVFGILDNMGIVITDEERLKIEVVQTENMLALLAYGKGLDASDRGKHVDAAREFNSAFNLDPRFSQAARRAAFAKEAAAALGQGPDAEKENEQEQLKDIEIMGAGPEILPDLLESRSSRGSALRRMSGVAGRSFMPEASRGGAGNGKTDRGIEDRNGIDHLIGDEQP